MLPQKDLMELLMKIGVELKALYDIDVEDYQTAIVNALERHNEERIAKQEEK